MSTQPEEGPKTGAMTEVTGYTSSTEESNPWSVRYRAPSDWDSTGWFNARETQEKLDYLKEKAESGHCYLWMITCADVLIDAPFSQFKEVVDSLRECCGQYPVAKEFMVEMMGVLLAKFQDSLKIDTTGYASVSLVEHMMCSRMRFCFEDTGNLHLDVHTVLGCDCEEFYCDHGYSARFVYTALCVSRKKIGGTLNLDDLELDSGDEDTVYTEVEDWVKPLQTARPPPSVGAQRQQVRKPGKYETRMEDIDELAELNRTVSEIIEKAGGISGSILGSRAEKAKRRISGKMQELTSEISRRLESDMHDLGPEDSSSHFTIRDQRQGRYMRQGTVLERGVARKEAPTHLELIEEDNLKSKEVAVGYMKTTLMLQRERDLISSVRTINGLAIPYRSYRLNVLAHIDTALSTTEQRVGRQGSLLGRLMRFMSSKPRSPSEELLLMVLNTTFDTDGMLVSSNGFELPYLEVGMSITDDCMVKCFDLLKMEYKALWFKEQKSLAIPKFHSDYSTVKEERVVNTRGESSSHSESRRKSRGSFSETLLSYART